MTEAKIQYVLGFAFTANRSQLVLIKKTRPDWQAGKLNGIGGHLEPDDASGHAAMAREFQEETGVVTQPEDWCHYAVINANFGQVQVYCLFDDKVLAADTRTDETVGLFAVDIAMLRDKALPTTSLLVEAALDENIDGMFLQVAYTHKPAIAKPA